jgi:cell division protein FtsX
MSSLAGERRFLLSATAKAGVTAAVIEEARRRQHRRRLLGTLAALVLAVVAGAVSLGLRGSGQSRQLPVATHQGRLASSRSITLYLRRDASRSAILDTIALVTHEPGVARVTFVSRSAAFRTMKQRYPKLLSSVTYNPLTASIDVRLITATARASIVPRLRRLPIVVHIRSTAPNK